MARRSDALIYAATVVATLFACPVVWHHYYLLAAAPLLLVRHGAGWYLLIGWASTAARASYGVSWLWLTAAANVALALVVGALIWNRRRVLSAVFRRSLFSWLPGAVGIGLVLFATIGYDALVRGLIPTALPVGACIAVLVVAYARTAPRSRAAAI